MADADLRNRDKPGTIWYVSDKPVNVDEFRRLLNASPDELSDDDLRRCLAVLASEYHEGSAKAAIGDLSRLPSGMDALREHLGPPAESVPRDPSVPSGTRGTMNVVERQERLRIQWGRTQVGWTGQRYSMAIPVYLDRAAALWLEHTLHDRLAALPELDGGEVSVIPATPAQPRPGDRVTGYDEPGYITIEGIEPPWPDPKALREVIGDAVEDAYETAEQSMDVAAAYERQLRETNQHRPKH